MTFDEAMTYIRRVQTRGSVYGLERMGVLLDELDCPQKDLRFIHVAGTNGKGSVCAFIDSILREAGFRTGRFISPTLFDYRERIQINGRYIEKQAVARYVEQLKAAADRMTDRGLEAPTLFEMETAMGFMYFRDESCDYVVLETGMGGRMDSTNIIPPPQVAVITAISLDHMVFLGDTEEKIAAQKAGIIKPGSRSVLYSQGKTVMRVLENACLDAASPVTETDWGQLKVWEEAMERQVFDYRHRKGLVIKLSGRYQIKNACTALDAVDCLNKDGAGITEGQIREGLLKTVWRGRFERISRHPDVIVDGAHNPAGARSLSESLKAYFPDKKKILVMGVFADKDYENILKIMASTGDRLITFRPDHPRGLDSGKLAKTAEKYFENVRDGKDVAGALRIAYETATEKDIIACFGSLSTIAPICDIIFTKAPSRADSFVYKGEALAQETE